MEPRPDAIALPAAGAPRLLVSALARGTISDSTERGVAQGGATIGFGGCRDWRARGSTTGERQPSKAARLGTRFRVLEVSMSAQILTESVIRHTDPEVAL